MTFRALAALAAFLPFLTVMPGEVRAQAAAPAGVAVGPADLCPANLVGLAGSPGAVVGCWCPGGGAGVVWGTGPYAVVSDLCAAARHAGAIGAGGGAVWARIAAGREAYEASAANDVETLPLGPFPVSLEILGAPAVATGDVPDCPETAETLDATLRCTCPAARVGIGAAWGTDIYTYDSTLCTAALHAGAVTREGGVVTVTPMAGQQSYAGSTRNGVTTQSYGSWGGSMRFE